ncbi:MAG: 3'(2'),5'-bisphosphate nucleotidase CysQ [Sandaracinus sp.]|nr:3'(2'),5'-bisphosphate nucleotidase CysQ [Sandaracinus sp.]|tara:strand:- start:1577 stop:2404 length:828 start_codon:yes stop_codon:yes gene_type:complete
MALRDDLVIARRIAREAGAILMDIYGTDFDVAYKGKANPVTEADTKANAFIVKELRAAFPGDGIVAEETADRSDATGEGRCWYVDPLDGTKEFIAKNGEFAVMLGLTIDGESKLGVVFQPAKDKLYAGIVGEGATLTEGGEEKPLEVTGTAAPADLRLVVSRSHRSSSIDRVVQELGIQNETKSGSVGLKVGLIAEQIADLYVHVSDKASAWDACGPEAILRAAGGRFTRLDGKPFHYAGQDVKTSGGILACNAAAFEAVLPVAHEVGKASGLAV